VRTLTGKEIELDIEPDYKVRHRPGDRALPQRLLTMHTTQKHQDNLADKAPPTGLSHQGACRGEGGHSPSTTALDFRRQANVCARTVQEMDTRETTNTRLIIRTYRNDDKTASEYQLEGGATLHLVLALRGGR
jgi:hypothetical protein